MFEMPHVDGYLCTPAIFEVPLPPLPWNCYNARGHQITSSFFLFTLPAELISLIAPYLTASDLKVLALVDRDCRQLARSIQFAHYTFYFSDPAAGFLDQLKLDYLTNSLESGIGPWIRSVRLAINWKGIRSRGRAYLDYNTYFDTFLFVLQHALPNVEKFHLDDSTILTTAFMLAIYALPLRILKLDEVAIDGPYTDVKYDGPCNWALEALSVEMPQGNSSKPGDSPAFIIDILSRASPTLRTFLWHGPYPDEIFAEGHSGYSFRSLNLAFPRLENLYFLFVTQADESVLGSLLPSDVPISLKSLAIDIREAINPYLSSRGCIPSLKALHWLLTDLEQLDATFIFQNPQLRSLTMYPLPTSFLEMQLLPTLRTHFHSLTALSVSFSIRPIPRSSLVAVGQITALEHLWIRAYATNDLPSDWAINHNSMLQALMPLRRLQHLVFFGDSYVIEPYQIYEYYTRKPFPRETSLTFIVNDKSAWERWHGGVMANLALTYAQSFPMLQWCFIGQLPIKIVSALQDGKVERKAVIEAERTSTTYPFPLHLWGYFT